MFIILISAYCWLIKDFNKVSFCSPSLSFSFLFRFDFNRRSLRIFLFNTKAVWILKINSPHFLRFEYFHCHGFHWILIEMERKHLEIIVSRFLLSFVVCSTFALLILIFSYFPSRIILLKLQLSLKQLTLGKHL